MGNTNTWSGAQQTTNYRYHPGEIRTAESKQTLLLVVEVRFPWLMMALDGLDGCWMDSASAATLITGDKNKLSSKLLIWLSSEQQNVE